MIQLPQRCPVSLTLIVINALFFTAQISTQGTLTNLGVLYGPLVLEGQWWRLLSSGFLHGGILHVAFNMYLLFVLGPILERELGSARFSLIYFGALFGSTLSVMMFDWDQATLGASGAVLGLAGALGVSLYERGMKPQQSPVFGLVVLNLALPLLVPVISFWGHFGGVAAGMLMGYLLVWLPKRSNGGSLANTLSIGSAGLVLFAALSWMAARMGGFS